jgi:hypothetical protein
MQPEKPAKVPVSEADLMAAHDALQLMLIEYGDVHIETLGQLLRLTRSAEEEYSRICIRRLCS